MVDNLEVWPDHERRLTLTKKDVCRGVHRLRCRCAHRHLHDADGGDLGVGVNELESRPIPVGAISLKSSVLSRPLPNRYSPGFLASIEP